MNFYNITMEDLVSNAMIALLQYNNTRFVSYHALEAYGSCIAEQLKKNGNRVQLALSRRQTQIFLEDFDNIFSETTQNEVSGITLSGCTVGEVRMSQCRVV